MVVDLGERVFVMSIPCCFAVRGPDGRALRGWVALACLCVLMLAGAGCTRRSASVPASPGSLVPVGAVPVPCALGPIENAFRIGPRLFSGGEPHGDAAFAALAAAGVRTVVSVDGAQPDVAAAQRQGMRYVHVPIGYEGIGPEALASLVAAGETSRGAVFVHCHHGKHRGPTAAAILARSAGAWDAAQAEAWQKAAGTSTEYAGLYHSVRDFRMPEREVVQAAARGLRPAVAPAGLVEMMVAIDGHAEALSDMKAAGWKAVAGRPDETPVGVARLLHEQFREGVRLGVGPKEAAFADSMKESEASGGALVAALAAGDVAGADAAWRQVKDQCARCHRGWRNSR